MSEPGTIALDAEARRRGRSVEAIVTAEIPPGTHIEPHVPAEPTLIPTEVEVEGLERPAVDYPEPVTKELGYSDAALSVYEGRVRFVVRGEAAPDVEIVRGEISYQPCVGGACLPPRTAAWETELEGARASRPGRDANGPAHTRDRTNVSKGE